MKTSPFFRPNVHWGILVLASLLIGCGQKSHATARLGGTIRVDGQPIPRGSIEFRSQDQGTAAVAQAEIEEGRYLAPEVPLGKVLVLFKATRETGKTVLVYNQPKPEVANIIPARYRLGMVLEITGDNPNQNFELTSKSTR